jgi:hypothetical protein
MYSPAAQWFEIMDAKEASDGPTGCYPQFPFVVSHRVTLSPSE